MNADEKIEIVARAMAAALGRDPDGKRTATGYPNSPIVKHWEMEREWAIRFIAAVNVAAWGS